MAADGAEPDGQQLADGEIVRAVVAGDRDLFKHLVSRHKNGVYALLMRQIGNHAVAEELAQEVFVRAFRALPSFRGDASFRTWITKIAMNAANSYFQSKGFKQERVTEALDPVKHDRPSSEGTEGNVKLSFFRSALAALSPKLRDALVLVGLEGRKYEDAATILDVPVGTIRSRVNKARLLLKQDVERRIREEALNE